MKSNWTKTLLVASTLLFAHKGVSAAGLAQLTDKKWFSGVQDCQQDTHPAIEILRYDADTYILRQNKCLHYEANFIYLLIGADKALLLDTGATADPDVFPIKDTVMGLLRAREQERGMEQSLHLIVTHSHGHSDHIAADDQFKDQPNVTFIDPSDVAAKKTLFSMQNWAKDMGKLELGERKLSVFSVPGHHQEAVAIYDHNTQLLLTGDNFYPGLLFIKDWAAYKASTARLVHFVKNHPVIALLGSHIEMTDKPGEYYPIGSTYQPEEASLVLLPEDLYQLHTQLSNMQKPERVALDKVVIYPVPAK